MQYRNHASVSFETKTQQIDQELKFAGLLRCADQTAPYFYESRNTSHLLCVTGVAVTGRKLFVRVPSVGQDVALQVSKRDI